MTPDRTKAMVETAALFASIIEPFDESRHVRYSMFINREDAKPKVCAVGAAAVVLLGEGIFTEYHSGQTSYDEIMHRMRLVAAQRTGQPISLSGFAVVVRETMAINDSKARPFTEVAALLRESFDCAPSPAAGTDG